MRSITDHGTHVSVCKTCFTTVADTPAEAELDDKEREHICKMHAKGLTLPSECVSLRSVDFRD